MRSSISRSPVNALAPLMNSFVHPSTKFIGSRDSGVALEDSSGETDPTLGTGHHHFQVDLQELVHHDVLGIHTHDARSGRIADMGEFPIQHGSQPVTVDEDVLGPHRHAADGERAGVEHALAARPGVRVVDQRG